MVSEMILDHARDLGFDPQRPEAAVAAPGQHQHERADRPQRVLGREPAPGENVIILDTYANTCSAGSIIAFHTANDDFAAGDTGLICSFGAGYSVGTVFVRKR